MYKRIMIALDGSKLAEEGIPAAMELAKQMGSCIILVQVCEIFALLDSDKKAEEAALRERATEYLKCIECQIEPDGIDVFSEVLTGKPGKELCRYAVEKEVDLIVMTTHGSGGFTSWAVGSVSEDVVRCASIPVLLLRSKDAN